MTAMVLHFFELQTKQRAVRLASLRYLGLLASYGTRLIAQMCDKDAQRRGRVLFVVPLVEVAEPAPEKRRHGRIQLISCK
jgi:hypothetical protein